MNSFLSITNLNFAYTKNSFIFKELTLEFLDNIHTISIVGPDGIGKSTLLKLLFALLKPNSGSIKFFNQELKQIYEYEKNLFIKTLPDIAIRQAEYFLMNSPKSLGEVLAETNLIINAPQKWNGIGTRTMFLQQYFPKTIAFIAKEYEKLY